MTPLSKNPRATRVRHHMAFLNHYATALPIKQCGLLQAAKDATWRLSAPVLAAQRCDGYLCYVELHPTPKWEVCETGLAAWVLSLTRVA